MLLRALLSLNKVNWRRVERLGIAGAAVLLVVYVYLQHVALKNNQLIYERPRVIERVRIVRQQGTVRIVTKWVKTPEREEVIQEEVRAPVVEIRETAQVSEPVFPPAPRTDRWLAGLSAEPFHLQERGSWRAYGGYSFRNRVDLAAGISGRGRAQLLVMFRF